MTVNENSVADAIAGAMYLSGLADQIARSAGDDRMELKDRMGTHLDVFVSRLLRDFPERANDDDIDQVFHRHYELSEDEIGSIPDPIVPLVIVRELVSRHKVIVDQKKVSHWVDFVEKYESAI